MKLKNKSEMTGRQLCDLEEIVFPILLKIEGENPDPDLLSGLIQKNGDKIVKLCYTLDNGSMIEEINEPYRMQLLQDFPNIFNFIFEEKSSGKQEQTPAPMKIKR